jgi:RHS repeat-associated protein
VLAATTDGVTQRYLHDARGIAAWDDDQDGQVVMHDGLGSVRGLVDWGDVQAAQHYAPYGEPWGTQGTFVLPYAFTGQPRDTNGLQYHRARYYAPAWGVFVSRDPVKDAVGELIPMLMLLNRYSYVGGNPTNLVDPSGMIMEMPGRWDGCRQRQDALSCDTWLDYAYAELRRGGDWANESADILEKYRRGQGIWCCDEVAATVILFRDSLGPIQPSAAPVGNVISVDRNQVVTGTMISNENP